MLYIWFIKGEIQGEEIPVDQLDQLVEDYREGHGEEHREEYREEHKIEKQEHKGEEILEIIVDQR